MMALKTWKFIAGGSDDKQDESGLELGYWRMHNDDSDDTDTGPDVLQQFNSSMIERAFNFDQKLHGFGSKYISFTEFDLLPGGGILSVLHWLSLLLALLFTVSPATSYQTGLLSCISPTSEVSAKTTVILFAYASICTQSFANFLLIVVQQRLIFYNRRTIYQAKKLRAEQNPR
jgi:hypothetical protein